MRVIILLVLLGSDLAVPRSPNRIVGGTETNVETYPYMSKVQVSTIGIWWSQWCGGSLITSTAVLSAAHCYFDDFGWSWQYRIVLGTSLASSGGTVHTINRIIIHPQYVHETLDNDVAIVRLNTPAVFSDRIQTARIPGPNYNLDDGAPVRLVGWGQLYYGGPVSEQLMHVHGNVINQQLCAERYAYLKTQPDYEDAPQITDGMVCTGIFDVGGKDACGGDSGGPVAHFGDIIVGVISWSFECADPFYPGVSVRVSHFTDWIVANAS